MPIRMKYKLLLVDSPLTWSISARADLHFLKHLSLSKPARIEQCGELWAVALHWGKVMSCFSYSFPCVHAHSSSHILCLQHLYFMPLQDCKFVEEKAGLKHIFVSLPASAGSVPSMCPWKARKFVFSEAVGIS